MNRGVGEGGLQRPYLHPEDGEEGHGEVRVDEQKLAKVNLQQILIFCKLIVRMPRKTIQFFLDILVSEHTLFISSKGMAM